MTPRFVDFPDLSPEQRAEAVRVLREAFADRPGTFEDEADAEVESFLEDEDRAAFAAVEGGRVVGWIGRVATYDHAWELHPLAVDPAFQRRGIGAALTRELEARAKAAGVLTLYLGTDDEYGGTNLFGAALYPDVAGKIAGVRATARGHPFAFYRRLGYEIVGLIPDANGPGKPDILMAKRL
ncbi:GNAT family N-acetyltransferase [Phenylobacterium sp.]|uniref:GNAT family N-acetyltransferase n=1 Tax=Phenylobacterium sp. TaxID=1871053 RepID=UPI00301D0C51